MAVASTAVSRAGRTKRAATTNATVAPIVRPTRIALAPDLPPPRSANHLYGSAIGESVLSGNTPDQRKSACRCRAKPHATSAAGTSSDQRGLRSSTSAHTNASRSSGAR